MPNGKHSSFGPAAEKWILQQQQQPTVDRHGTGSEGNQEKLMQHLFVTDDGDYADDGLVYVIRRSDMVGGEPTTNSITSERK
jgi:hypothetical protein